MWHKRCVGGRGFYAFSSTVLHVRKHVGELLCHNPLTPTAGVSVSKKKFSLRIINKTRSTLCQVVTELKFWHASVHNYARLQFMKDARKKKKTTTKPKTFSLLSLVVIEFRRTDLCVFFCGSLNSPIARTLYHSPEKDTGTVFLPCALGYG